MTFQEFDNLLQRYLKDQCTPEERELVEKWYDSFDNEPANHLSEHQRVVAEERLRQSLNKLNRPTSKQKFLTLPYISAVAAAVLLLIISIWILDDNTEGSTTPAAQEVVAETETIITNTTAKALTHILGDGSTATLQPGSEIRYRSAHFSNNRELTLVGEAFFEVKKDKQHPFVVYAGGLVTKVLGTSFIVSAHKGVKEVVVSVKTGKVSVSAQQLPKQSKTKQEVILNPNQTAIYDAASDLVVKGQATVHERVDESRAAKAHFANASVLQIFKMLEETYGVEIKLNPEALEACKVTTTLANETLFEKLDIICQAIGAKYEVIDGTILIESEGCN